MARRSWFASLAAGLVLVTAGACAPLGSGSTAGAGSDAYGSIGMDCATDPFTVATVTPAPSPQPSPMPSMPLPADAVLTSATRCQYPMLPVPGDGWWLMRVEQRVDSGLDTLAAALRLPSQRGPAGGGCAAIGYPPNVITVTDSTGRVFHPVLPTGPCDSPLKAAVEAINMLPWQTTATTKLRQTRSELEVKSDCPGSYKPVVALIGTEGRRDNAEVFAIDTTPTPVRVCLYTLDPTETIDAGSQSFHLGKLATASTLEGESARALLTAVAAAPPATASCPGEAPFAVLTLPKGPELTVELGGCYRALVGNSLRQLDAATVKGWHLA